MYTHKTVMRVGGTARVGGDELEYRPDVNIAKLDEFKSYWSMPARWTWGTTVGRDSAGASIALNAVDYYTPRQKWWNENCCWIDGKIVFLGPVKWELNKDDPDKPWRLREASGRIDALFHPEGGKMVDHGRIGFKYYQKCGRYEGFLIDDGVKHEFSDCYGVAENVKIG